ncbi:GNAT family N-acetyltransferase [Paenibacillus sp. PR3]|uniref:GNAT family N-acetyltransferase n=1 Tax=Paenibacillus terricola TaxID=2763503 RepID=A0ABR8MYM6_9BACL|nr:GNAT family N-acetyltransferase [Paenibacillus terricola]MBD3920416.1 GNAT family N-acetyltransferase [Paenibacillus terricola]
MTIQVLHGEDKKSVLSLFRIVTKDLQGRGIRQWDRFYPNRWIIGSDIKRHNMFGIRMDGRVVAAVVVDANQSDKYKSLAWSDRDGTPSCIHRLVVHPEYQGRGLGKQLLQYAEALAKQQGSSSIRLDVYKGNPSAVNMYSRANYKQVGEVKYPMREIPYLVMEKVL